MLADVVKYNFLQWSFSVRISGTYIMEAFSRSLLSFFLLAFLLASTLPSPKKWSDLPGKGFCVVMTVMLKKRAAFRSEWSERIEADQNPVVFLGDSIACGWGKI